MQRELQAEMDRILGRLANAKAGTLFALKFGKFAALEIDAVRALEEIGYLEEINGSKTYRITMRGREAYQESKESWVRRFVKKVIPWATSHAWPIAVVVIGGLILAWLGLNNA